MDPMKKSMVVWKFDYNISNMISAGCHNPWSKSLLNLLTNLQIRFDT